MSTKGDWDRTGDSKKAGDNYTRIFGTEEEVKERRRKWIEEKKRKEREGDIAARFPDPPKLVLPKICDEALEDAQKALWGEQCSN